MSPGSPTAPSSGPESSIDRSIGTGPTGPSPVTGTPEPESFVDRSIGEGSPDDSSFIDRKEDADREADRPLETEAGEGDSLDRVSAKIEKDLGVDSETKERAHSTVERIRSLQESLQAELEQKPNRIGERLANFFFKGQPQVREKLNLALSGASLLANLTLLGTGMDIPLRAARTVLGVWNYGATSSRLLMNRQLKNEIPTKLARTEELFKQLEDKENPPAPHEARQMQDELEELLAFQVGIHRQGIDLSRYTEESKSTKPTTSKWEQIKTWATSKEGMAKIALYSAPVIAAALVPTVGLPIMAAKAAYLAATGYSTYERFKQMKQSEAEHKEPKPAMAEHTSELIKRYQIAAGLQVEDVSSPDEREKIEAIQKLSAKLAGAAKSQQANLWKRSAKSALPGALGAALFYGLVETQHAHAATPDETPTSGETTGDADTGERPSTTETTAASATEERPSAEETVRGPEPSAPTPTEAASSERPSLAESFSTEREPGGDDIISTGERPSLGETVEKSPAESIEEAFKSRVAPEFAAEHNFGQEFTQDGKHWVMLDLNNDGEKSKIEMLEMIRDGDGQRYVMMPMADLQGQDGIPEIMDKFEVKVPVGKDGDISLENKFGFLVDRNDSEKYVALDSHTRSSFVEKSQARIFHFQTKAHIMEDTLKATDAATGGSNWDDLQKRLGEDTLKRPDWAYTVGRGGAMGSIDTDIVPEIQVAWDQAADTLVGQRGGLEYYFEPTVAPSSHEEMLKRTGGDAILAKAAERMSYVFPDLSLQLDAIRISEDTRDPFDKILETLKESSSEMAARINELTAAPELKNGLIRKLMERVHDNRISRLDLLDVLSIPTESPDFTSLKKGDHYAPDKLPELSNHFDELRNYYKDSPWAVSLVSAARTMDEYGKKITDMYVHLREDGSKVFSILLPGNRIKEHLLPPNTFRKT